MRRATQFTLALSVAMTIVGYATSFAQTPRSCNLGVEVTLPANNATIAFGDTAKVEFNIVNEGPDAILKGDTIFYALVDGSGSEVLIEVATADIAKGASHPVKTGFYFLSDTTVDLNGAFCIGLLNQSAVEYEGGVKPLVTYNDNDTTNDVSCVEFTMKGSGKTSIFDLKDVVKSDLQIYPNPAVGIIRFDLILEKQEEVIVSVKDIAGREVLRKDYGKMVKNAKATLELNVADLGAGLYFVELNMGTQKAVGRVTVQK